MHWGGDISYILQRWGSTDTLIEILAKLSLIDNQISQNPMNIIFRLQNLNKYIYAGESFFYAEKYWMSHAYQGRNKDMRIMNVLALLQFKDSIPFWDVCS